MHQKTTLSNGLRIVTTTMPQTYSVSVSFFLGVGSRYESDGEAGISHLIEHMCFKGTDKRPTSLAVAEAIEGVGGILNGGTDKEFTLYWAKVTRPHFLLALEVLSDMFLHSRFDPEELEKERQVVIEEIHRSKDSPSQRVSQLTDELLYPGHPLGRDVAGDEVSLVSVGRVRVLSFLERHYKPSTTVVAIAGNIEHAEAVAAVHQVVGNWISPAGPAGYVPFTPTENPRLSVEKRDTEQAHMCLALPGLSLLDPQRFALGVLNVILGEGMSSRLFAEIRDKLGLAYNIGSYVDHFLDTGSLTVCAGVDPKNLPRAIKAVLDQLAAIRKPVPPAELAKAKEQAKGRLLLGMEDSRNVANWMGGQETLAARILTVEQVVAIIDAVSAADLQKVALELLVPEKLRLAVVGPVAAEGLADLLGW